MDLRDTSSLMASQRAIKMDNSHEWIDTVIKTEKLQIFWKSHKLIILERDFKSNYTRERFQVASFSIFDLYLISKEGYLDMTNVKFHWLRYKVNI
jgi:hypothetical protein